MLLLQGRRTGSGAWCSPSRIAVALSVSIAIADWGTQSMSGAIGQPERFALLSGASGVICGQAMAGFARAGMGIVFACRPSSFAKCQRLAAQLSAPVDLQPVDFEDMVSVEAFITRVRERYATRLEVVVNCARAPVSPARVGTRDGLEAQFQVDVLSYFALMLGLLDALAPNASVVNVASRAIASLDWDELQDLGTAVHTYPQSGFRRYAQMKWAERLLTKKAAALYPGVYFNALQPGCVQHGGKDRVASAGIQFLLPDASHTRQAGGGSSDRCGCCDSANFAGDNIVWVARSAPRLKRTGGWWEVHEVRLADGTLSHQLALTGTAVPSHPVARERLGHETSDGADALWAYCEAVMDATRVRVRTPDLHLRAGYDGTAVAVSAQPDACQKFYAPKLSPTNPLLHPRGHVTPGLLPDLAPGPAPVLAEVGERAVADELLALWFQGMSMPGEMDVSGGPHMSEVGSGDGDVATPRARVDAVDLTQFCSILGARSESIGVVGVVRAVVGGYWPTHTVLMRARNFSRAVAVSWEVVPEHIVGAWAMERLLNGESQRVDATPADLIEALIPAAVRGKERGYGGALHGALWQWVAMRATTLPPRALWDAAMGLELRLETACNEPDAPDFHRWACFHGLGHGAFLAAARVSMPPCHPFRQGARLPADTFDEDNLAHALSICAAAPPDARGGDRLGQMCATGVFHWYFERTHNATTAACDRVAHFQEHCTRNPFGALPASMVMHSMPHAITRLGGCATAHALRAVSRAATAVQQLARWIPWL